MGSVKDKCLIINKNKYAIIPIKKRVDFILKFTFVTLFPNLIEPYFQDSILKRAVESNFISYEFYNPRDFTTNKQPTTEQRRFSRWVNHQAIFNTVEWSQYR